MNILVLFIYIYKFIIKLRKRYDYLFHNFCEILYIYIFATYIYMYIRCVQKYIKKYHKQFGSNSF